jgi:hypothetical protein
VRRLLVLLALTALIIPAAGCGGSSAVAGSSPVDPLELVTILPTPKGFAQSSDARSATAADVQATLARTAKPDVAAEYEGLGFKGAAIRTWQGPGGAKAVIVASRWQDHLTATNIGAGPSQILLGKSGVRAWTPSDLPGARGVQVDGASPSSVLSLAVDDISVFMRVDGAVDPDVLVRTLDLAARRLQAASGTA